MAHWLTLVRFRNAFTSAKSNQMDPEQAMIKQIYKNLFAQHVYSKDPKGEATEIVTLTYEEAVAYYNSYYHPSNGQAFCYGKQEFVDACLKELEPVLEEYNYNEGIRRSSKIDWQDMTNLSTEKKMIGYPSWQDEIDYRSVVAWVLNDSPMDLRTEVSWLLIFELLAGSSSAPIPKAITDLNLGDDLVTYFESSLQQWVMALGVSGITSEEKVQIARNAIDGKLRNIVNNGFSRNSLEAGMNKIEFRFREQSTTDMPRGVKTFDSVLRHWNYDRDPLTSMKYMKAFADLKEEIEKEGQDWLLGLLTRRMFNSKHTTYLDLFPDRNYAQGWQKMENDWINSLDQYITAEEGKQMLAETAEMKKVQAADDSQEALSRLPRLRVSDLAKEVYTPPTVIDDDLFDSGVTVLHHELPFSNGISYVDFAIDISNMDFDDVVLLPLFCRLLLEGGTKGYTDVDMQQKIDRTTGGLSVYPLIDEIVQTNADGSSYVVPDGKHFVTKIVVSGSCVAANGCLPMFNLFRNVLFDSDVRNEMKARELLEQMIDDLEDDIQINGHKYTTYRIASRYSLNGFINEQWKGLTQLMQMRRALEQLKNDFSALSLRLIKMQDAMARGNRNGMVLSVSGDKQSLNDTKGAVELFFKDVLPLATQSERFPDFAKVEHPWVSKGTHRMNSELDNEQRNQAIIVPTRVNHVGKGGLLYEIGEAISGADEVVTSFLGGYYLYDQLRYSQGALHAWAVLDADSGVLIYQSDRDPSIEQTLKVYENGANWLWQQVHEGNLPIEAEAAIIGAIGRLDGSAVQPNRVGIESVTNYLKQNTVEMRQQWRNQIIGATTADFMEMVERLGAWGQPSVVVVTSQETFNTIDQADLPMSSCAFSGLQCSSSSGET
jgi:Zn-dependent M16 (insulinase) family peptidase